MSPSRAPAHRPTTILLDVFETTLSLAPLRQRFVELSRAAGEFDLFFARLLRDGMAQSLAGESRPFADIARAQLRTTSGLTGAVADEVLAGFRSLPAHDDVVPGLRMLAAADVSVWAFTHGSAAVAEESLAHAGVGDHLRGVLSAEELRAFKPPARVYEWACARVRSDLTRTALLAAHSWDTHGAVSAGLVGALITRHEGWVNEAMATPHVSGKTFDATVRKLLELPSE